MAASTPSSEPTLIPATMELSLELDQINVSADDTVKTIKAKLISKGRETMGEPGFSQDTVLYYDEEFLEWCMITNLKVIRTNPKLKFVRSPGFMTQQSWYPKEFLQFAYSPFWVEVKDPSTITSVPIQKWVHLHPNLSIMSTSINGMQPLYDHTHLTNYTIKGGWLIMDNKAGTIFFEQNARFTPGDVHTQYFITAEQGFDDINDALTHSTRNKDGYHIITMAALIPSNPSHKIYLCIFMIE